MSPLTKKFTFSDLRRARESGDKLAMLTCYDFSTARLMQEAGVPMLLVGDSAANVILGHDTTVSAPLAFMIEITAAVRRGAPKCLVCADMPFGSYGGDISRGFRNVIRMMKLSAADCVKLEVGPEHHSLIGELAGIGVAVIAHIGLRPQSVGISGGYRSRGRSADDAADLVETARDMEASGAAALLLEAVTPDAAAEIVRRTSIPVIGCGAGSACHAHVVVTHDAIGLSPGRPPRFVPALGDVSQSLKRMFASYVDYIRRGDYPAAEHQYEMLDDGEREKFSVWTGGDSVKTRQNN